MRNLAGFARFMPVAALFHGQTLNIASAARDAEVSRTTLAGYVDILEDTLVAFRLPAYDPKLRVRERKHPKLYWIDPGLARAAAGRFRDLDPRERGPLFEGWIATVLASYRRLPRSVRRDVLLGADASAGHRGRLPPVA